MRYVLQAEIGQPGPLLSDRVFSFAGNLWSHKRVLSPFSSRVIANPTMCGLSALLKTDTVLISLHEGKNFSPLIARNSPLCSFLKTILSLSVILFLYSNIIY